MKNRAIKTFFAAFTAGVMLFSAAFAVGGYEYLPESGYVQVGDTFITRAEFDAFIENRDRSMEILHGLFDSFGRGLEREVFFPVNYGGAYLDYYGNLVVLEVSSLASRADISIAHALSESGAAVREAEFPYLRLRMVWDYLNYFIPAYRDNADAMNVSGIRLNIPLNRIIVELIDYSEEQIDIFRDTVSDSCVLIFAQAGEPPVPVSGEPSVAGTSAGNRMRMATREADDLLDFLTHVIRFERDANPGAANANGVSWIPGGELITVHLLEYSEEQIRIFRETVSDSPMIAFRCAHPLPMTLTPVNDPNEPFEQWLERLNAGELSRDRSRSIIENEPNNLIRIRPGQTILFMRGTIEDRMLAGPVSVGYRAMRNGVSGFVTVAHATYSATEFVRPGDFVITQGTQILGTVEAVRLDNVDAVFVRLEPNVIFENPPGGGGYVMAHTQIPGDMLEAVGARSGVRRGRAYAPFSGFVPFPGGYFWIQDAIDAGFRTEPGDSGGMVTVTTNAPGRLIPVSGIVVATSGHGSLVSQATEIRAHIGGGVLVIY